MRRVHRSALVPYSAAQMYSLVKDVEAYSSFLPWCDSAEVHTADDAHVEASLSLRRGLVSKTFRTRNALTKNESLGIALVGGPFKHMAGGWTFEQLGDDGCKVDLTLEFEFESRAVDAIFGRFLESTCNSLVDSFTQRAAAVYAD